MDWTVNGECLSNGSWKPFEGQFQGETKAEARWAARRAKASGEAVASIDPQPVGVERQRVERTQGDRRVNRTDIEDAEYDRLVRRVRIVSVEPV